jgi:predicted nucleic acid-binding protein
MNLIVDASVAAKYLIREPDTDEARALFQAWQQGRFDLLAPSLLPAEVASALWKRVRRGSAPQAEAATLLENFLGLGVPLVPTELLVNVALKLALDYGHSVYDGVYVALALQTGWRFVTADARLHALLTSRLPQVCLLRDWRA